MRGKLYKHPQQGWIVKYSICVPGMITRQWGAELPLHPDNVKDIKEWSKVFDNIEGRISSNPEAEFEIVSGFNNNGPEHFPRYAKLIKDEEADLKDFDVTLMDGLEEEINETPVFKGSGQWHRRAYLYLKGDKVVFDCSDDEYGPIKFDLKDLEKALETHKNKKI